MKVDKAMFQRWKKFCMLFCQENSATVDDIKTGVMAWNVAFKLDIPREAYRAGLYDRHIATALKHIFPKAVFTDK